MIAHAISLLFKQCRLDEREDEIYHFAELPDLCFSISKIYDIYIFGELPVEEKIKANPDRDLGRVKSLPEWKILI